MLGAQASFVMMAVAGRELSDTMNTFQIMILRSSTGLVILLIIMLLRGLELPRTSRIKMHVFRNLFHYSAQTGWFFGVALLPLATVFAIEFTTPIWVAVMAVMFLGEKLNKGRTIAILFGFGGALVILRPTGGIINIESFYGSLGVLWAAVGFASTYIITKKLSSSESAFSILFWMLIVQVIVGIIPGAIVWVPISIGDIVWILIVGIGSLTAHFSVAKAVTATDVLTIMPLDFVRLPIAALIGLLVYNEAIELAVIIGAVVIFAANYYNIVVEKKIK